MSDTCTHPGCGRVAYRVDHCNAHRQRLRAGRDMDAPIRIVGNDEARFWQKVRKSGGCWEWAGSKNEEGYGRFRHHERPRRAHRVSYEWAKGAIPEGMEVDHTCHNRACVNPDHLRLATSSQNGQNLKGAYRNSKSGVRGVSWYEPRGMWRAEASKNGLRKFLGYFRSIEEAETVTTEWRREHMPYSLMDQKKVTT